MNCQKCGKELHQEEQSCSACGWNREETGAENGMAEGGTTAGNSALQQENAAAENEKRRIYPIISGIIMGAMALTIIVMGGYIAMDAWRAAPMESAMEDALLAEMRLFDENGLLAARIGETWGFIDKTGKWVINPQFQQVDAFAGNGLCAVQIPDGEQNGKWGYVNTKGEYAVSPNYEQAGRFAANGLAAVKE